MLTSGLNKQKQLTSFITIHFFQNFISNILTALLEAIDLAINQKSTALYIFSQIAAIMTSSDVIMTFFGFDVIGIRGIEIVLCPLMKFKTIYIQNRYFWRVHIWLY